MTSLYPLLALAVAAVLGTLAVAFAVRGLSPTQWDAGASAGDAVPTAPLQRLGITALASAAVPALACCWVLLYAGLDGYATRAPVRILTQLLGVFALVAGAGPVIVARRRAASGQVVLDERDERILASAPVTQMWTVLALVVGWTIALSEYYWDAGTVPLGAVAMLGWTTLIGWAVSLPLGIVLGYRVR